MSAPTVPQAPSTLQRPWDETYQMKRKEQVRELLRFSVDELKDILRYRQRVPAREALHDEGGQVQKEIFYQVQGDTNIPMTVKNILGSASGTGLTDGSPLIRQDLEPVIHALFIKTFPAWEAIPREPSNGLVHAYDQVTAPDPNTSTTGNTVSTVVTELGTVNFTASTYARQTANIAVFGIGRGVTFKEVAAVRQGGMNWDPSRMELANGALKLAYDVQTLLMQGNGTYSSGTANNEGGLYSNNPLYFDGLRLILGSVTGSNYASNNAVQVDQGALSMTKSIQTGAAKMGQYGGMPNLVFMSINAKQRLDNEHADDKRYNDATVEIVPGVRVNTLPWTNGDLRIISVPGFSIGSYQRSSDNQQVEDVYILDTEHISMPWLFAEGITTIELPAALDYTLSQRYILFTMQGLAVKAQPFMGKVRSITN